MLGVVLGAILGTAASLAIAHVYYRRSTRDLETQVAALRNEITRLQAMSHELQEAADVIQNDLEVTKRHVVAGTPDEPGWPHK